jgi:O-antigen/teichoic acid export membrane protein
VVIRNTFIIFVALLVSGLVNFGSISVFSRLLSPAEYGTFALATAASALSIAFLFQWVLHSFIRFLPQRNIDDNKRYMTNFMVLLAVMSVGFLALAVLGYTVNAGMGNMFTSLPLAVWILVPAAAIGETAFTAISHYTRLVREHIRLFAVATICRSLLYIGLGYYLVEAGYSYTGLLLALVLSFFVPGLYLWATDPDSRRLVKGDVRRDIVREIMAFGFPIIAVTTIQTAISSTDNFLLTYFIGPAATGQYAVALDLVTKSLIFLMVIVNRTTYPLLVKKLEHEGMESAQVQYRYNTIILMALSIPACVGLAILSKNIATLLLGEEFRETAGHLIPFLTLVSFTNCAFQFYLTPAFHLAKKTHLMIVPVVVAFIVNLLVSSYCIPTFGINGAIIGSFCAYLTSFALSLYFIKRVFPLPFPAVEMLKIMAAALLMGASIWQFQTGQSLNGLLLAVGIGGTVYGIACAAMNVGGARDLLVRKIKAKRAR